MTIAVIQRILIDRECEMKKNGVKFYNNYTSSPSHNAGDTLGNIFRFEYFRGKNSIVRHPKSLPSIDQEK